MILYVIGDLFYSPAKVLVNPVNTVGVMGKGLAHDFKRFYPDMFEQYQAHCQADTFDIGNLYLHKTPHKWVLNLPTKKHWRAESKPEYIEAGLQKFVASQASMTIPSISFPTLGTGQGGLDWESDVRPIMEGYLHPLPITVYVHILEDDDLFVPERRNVRAIRSWLNGQPKTIDFNQFWRDLQRATENVPRYQTLDDHAEGFRLMRSTMKRDERRRNLILRLDSEPKPLFIPESAFRDLWQYVCRVGYALPQNFPSGLEHFASYLIAVMTTVDYVRPIHLQTVEGDTVVGLHFISPLDRKAEPIVGTAQPV